MSSKQDGLNSSKVNSGARKQIKNSIRPALEQLETRMVPAKVVTTIFDTTNPSSPTPGSLRAAITLPSPADRVIEFNDYLFAASIGTTHNPTALALGDFRGTGKTDVISASAFINNYTFAPDNGNGVGILDQNSTANTTGIASNITAIEPAYLNADLFQDFVTLQSDGKIRAYLGSNTGNFTAGGVIDLGGIGAGLVVGDFDGDTVVDDFASVLTGVTGKIVYALGNGDGTFGTPLGTRIEIPLANGNQVAIAYADVTADGKNDIITLSSDGKLTTLPKSVSGFGTGVVSTVAGTTLTGLAMGNLNGDFIPDPTDPTNPTKNRPLFDAVIVNRTAGTITTMLGSATGAFTTGSVTTLTSGALPGVVRLANFNSNSNNDTNIDLAVTQYGLNNVAIYTGKGDGSFNLTATTFDVVAPTDIRVADMNPGTGPGKDSFKDLVVSSETTQSFAVYMNSGTGSFSPVASKQATFVINGAVGSINYTNNSNDIKIVAGNASGSLFPANTYDAQGNSLANKPRVAIQADVGFDQRDYDLTNTTQFPVATTNRGSGFAVNDILTQGITSTQGGARFQVLGVDAIGGITQLRVLQPGSQTIYDPFNASNTKISPPATLGQNNSSPYLKLTPLSGSGQNLFFATTPLSTTKRTSGLLFQNTPNRTLTLDGIAFNAANTDTIILSQGNLILQNDTFTDIDNLFVNSATGRTTDRNNQHFVSLQTGAGSLTVTNTRFDDGRVDAIRGNSNGSIAISGSTFTNMDGQALTISASKISIDSSIFTNNGDRTSGPSVNLFYPVDINGNLSMSAAGSINGTSSVTILNSVFENNSEDDAGPQTYQRSLKLTGGVINVSQSVFRNNKYNGALEVSGSQANINNTWFDGNSAPFYFKTSSVGDQYRGGSALLVRDATNTTLTANKFTNNLADNINSRFSGGGAVYVDSGTVTIDQCAFEGNSAKITNYFPGAETTDYIANPELSPSPRYSGGGAVYAGGATTISNSYFTNNSVISYVDLWQQSKSEATALSRPEYSGGGAVYLTRNIDTSIQSNVFNSTFVGNFVEQSLATKDINRAGVQRLDQIVTGNTTSIKTTNTANITAATTTTSFFSVGTLTVSTTANSQPTGAIFRDGALVQTFIWNPTGGAIVLGTGPVASGTLSTSGALVLNWAANPTAGAVYVSLYYQSSAGVTGAQTPTSVAAADVTGDGSNDVVQGGMGGLQVISGSGNASLGDPTLLLTGNIGQVGTANLDNAGESEIIGLSSTGATSSVGFLHTVRPGSSPQFYGSLTSIGSVTDNTNAKFTNLTALGSASARTVTYQLTGVVSRIINTTLTGNLNDGLSNVQSFTVNPSGQMVFTFIGTPAKFALSGKVDLNTGLVTVVWNSSNPGGSTSITNANYQISSIIAFATGDFDANNYTDAAYITTENKVYMAKNGYGGSGGTFSVGFATNSSFTTPGTPISVAFGKFDNSGDDVGVLSNNSGTYTVTGYIYDSNATALRFENKAPGTNITNTSFPATGINLPGTKYTKLLSGNYITNSSDSSAVMDFAAYSPSTFTIDIIQNNYFSAATTVQYFPLASVSTNFSGLDTIINNYIKANLYTGYNGSAVPVVDSLGDITSTDYNGDGTPDFAISVKLKSSDPNQPTDAVAIITTTSSAGFSGIKVFLDKANTKATLDTTVYNESTNKESATTPSTFFPAQTFIGQDRDNITFFTGAERAGTIYRDNTPVQNYFVDSSGNFTFEKIGLPQNYVSSVDVINNQPQFNWVTSDPTVTTIVGSNHISVRSADRVAFSNNNQSSTVFPAFPNTVPLASGGLTGFVFVGSKAVQSYSVSATGTMSFKQINPNVTYATSGSIDLATGILTLSWNSNNTGSVEATITYAGAPTATYYNALSNYVTTGNMTGTIYAGNTAVANYSTTNLATDSLNDRNNGASQKTNFLPLNHPIANTRTLTGYVFVGGIQVQSFTYNGTSFTFTDIGSPTIKATSGSLSGTNAISLTLNNNSGLPVYVSVSYLSNGKTFREQTAAVSIGGLNRNLAALFNTVDRVVQISGIISIGSQQVQNYTYDGSNFAFTSIAGAAGPFATVGTITGTYIANTATIQFDFGTSIPGSTVTATAIYRTPDQIFALTKIGTPSVTVSDVRLDPISKTMAVYWNGNPGASRIETSYKPADYRINTLPTLTMNSSFFPLTNGPIGKGTLGGTVFLNNKPIQTFSVDADGSFFFTDIGTQTTKATGGSIDPDTGVINLFWDATLTSNPAIIVSYNQGYNAKALASGQFNNRSDTATRNDIIAANANQSVSVFFGDGTGGLPNISPTGRGLNGGAIIVGEGRSVASPIGNQSVGSRSGSIDVRVYNTTIVSNSVINTYASNANRYPDSTSVYDPTRGAPTTASGSPGTSANDVVSPNSNVRTISYTSNSSYGNYADVGGLFDDTVAGSIVRLMNTVPINNTGIDYGYNSSSSGRPNITQTDLSLRPIAYSAGQFYSEGGVLTRPQASILFSSGGIGDITQSDQQVNFDSQELLDIDNFRSTIVGPSFSNIGFISAQLTETNTQKIKYLPLSRLSPARDAGRPLPSALNISLDIRGADRAVNNATDIGAYEVQVATATSLFDASKLTPGTPNPTLTQVYEYGEPISIDFKSLNNDNIVLNFTTGPAISGPISVIRVSDDAVLGSENYSNGTSITQTNVNDGKHRIVTFNDSNISGASLLGSGLTAVYASYGGDKNYASSQTDPFNILITKASTVVTLNSIAPVESGTPVTITGIIDTPKSTQSLQNEGAVKLEYKGPNALPSDPWLLLPTVQYTLDPTNSSKATFSYTILSSVINTSDLTKLGNYAVQATFIAGGPNHYFSSVATQSTLDVVKTAAVSFEFLDSSKNLLTPDVTNSIKVTRGDTFYLRSYVNPFGTSALQNGPIQFLRSNGTVFNTSTIDSSIVDTGNISGNRFYDYKVDTNLGFTIPSTPNNSLIAQYNGYETGNGYFRTGDTTNTVTPSGTSISFAPLTVPFNPANGTLTGSIFIKSASNVVTKIQTFSTLDGLTFSFADVGTPAQKAVSGNYITSSNVLSLTTNTSLATGDSAYVVYSIQSKPINLIIEGRKPTLQIASATVTPIKFGQTATYTATITGSTSPSVKFNGGTISLVDNAIPVSGATYTLPNSTPSGVDTSSQSFTILPAVGSHTYDLRYDGDGFNYEAQIGTGSPLALTVNKADTDFIPLIQSIYAAQSQSVPLTVNLFNGVSGASNTIKPTGLVSFYAISGASRIFLGSTTNSDSTSGAFTFNYTTTAGGNYPLTIDYSGDGNYLSLSNEPFGRLIVPTIALNLGGNPANVSRGANVSFTATISPAGTPSEQPGHVTFTFVKPNAIPILFNVPLNAGNPGLYTLSTQLGGATLDLANGSYTVTATYNKGSGDYPTMVSAARTLNVGLSSSTTTLTATTTSSLFRYGEDVTLDATVTGISGLNFLAPGSVDFIDGSKALNTSPLPVAGTSPQTVTFNSASLATALSVGTHNLQAKYTGDSANYLASASAVRALTVIKADTSASASVSPAYGIVVSGGALALQVTIGTPAYVSANAARPTGTVTFVSGGTTLGTATVNPSGVATLTINPTALGNFSVTATYGGDGNYNTSTIGTSYTVASLNFTPLASSVIQRGSLLTLSAAVLPNTDTRSNTPLGSVNFVIPGTPDTLITSVTLAQAANGVYSTTIDTGNPAFNLPVGNYNIVAKYVPGVSDAYPAITSNLQTLTVTQQATTTALATTPAAPATVRYGTSVNVNATVAPTINSGFPIPFTGSSTVNILDGTTIIRNLTITDAARSPAFDTKNLAAALSVGAHNLQAKYLGDGANYSASASAIQTITVNKADTSISVSGITPVTAIVTSSGALTFQVTISTPSYVEANASRPTGTVTFVSINNTPGSVATTLGTATVNASGVATLTINPTALGNFSVTATYGGDGNYNTSTIGTSYTVASLNFTPLASSVIQRGSLLTLSAAVLPNTDTRSNTPLGSVNFVIPGTPDTLITSVALAQAANGVYSTTIDTGNPAFNLPVGNYNIVAKYVPGVSDAYPAITSNLQTLTVTQQATTTALATTPAVTTSVPYGTSIIISATASSTINGGYAMPFTGTSAMRILDGSALLTTLNVSDSASGTSPSTAGKSFATSSLSTALSVGTHILQAKYQGDGVNYAASNSATQNINVVQASTSMLTSDLLVTPSRTVAAGTSITLTVKVTPDASVAANAIKPTGTVTFVATPSGGSTTTLGAGIVDPVTGLATITVSTQAVGNFAVVATYSGNGNYLTSSLNTSYTVAALNFAPLASNVIQRGSQLTLTADVLPSADSRSNSPLGYVNFVIPGTSADTLVASVNLSQAVNGRYSTTIDTGNPAFNLPVGSYKIVAKYVAGAGDAYPAIVSSEQSLVVTKQSITLGGSLDRTSLVYGGAVALTNSFITPFIAGSTIAFDANAFVTLFDGQTLVATIPFTDSFRTLVLPPVTFNAGVHNLQLRFAGDTNYQAGTFDLPTLTVSQAPANIALISSGFNQAVGKAFTLTAQVSTPQLNLPTNPSGTVTFSIDNTVVGQSTINASGQATFNFTPTAAGAYVVKASYSGDNNFGPPVSTTTTVVASTLTLSPIVPSIATLGGKITLAAISAPASDNVLFSQNGTVDFVLPNGIVVATATAENSTVTANGRLYSLNIDSGIAQYNLRAGTVTIRAVYRPGTNDPYPTLTSTAQSVQLNSQPTETVLVADPLASAPFGSPITITINTQSIVGAGNTATTIPFGSSGSISLFDGSTLLQKTVVSGSTLSTTFTIPVLSGGTHNLNAVYSGDSINFLGSKSNVVNLQINKAATSVTLTPNSGSTLVGVPVTLTATLASSVSTTFGLPTGSIQFKLGTTTLATVPVTGTTAKFIYTPSKSGMGAFTATYLESTNFATSSTKASLQFRARDPIFIVASQAGSTFMTYNAKTGKQISVFQPLGPTYTGGFRVAKGDVNADGYADFAYTTNTGSFVRVIDGRTQSSLGGFYAYTSTYNRPVNLAIGDINGDGRGDIIVAPGGSGFGPKVRAFSGANYATVLFDKDVYSTSFVSGVSVASADVNGDGKHDIVCAPMAGAGPNVVVFSGATGTLLNSINAIATGNKSGFSVTADDLTGDGKAEIILAAMSGAQQVIVLDGATLQPRNSFLPFGITFTGGSRVTTVEDIDGDGIRDIVVASGPNGNSLVRRFSGQDTHAIDSFFAYAATNAARNKGLFIA